LELFYFFYSLLGSGSVIVVSMVKKRHLDGQVRPLFQLALADFLAAAVLLSMSVINILTVLSIYNVCEYAIPLALSFYGTTFLLVMVYAYEAKQAVGGWRESSDGQVYDLRSCTLSNLKFPVLCLIKCVPGLCFLTQVVALRNSPAELFPSHPTTNLITFASDTRRNDYHFYCCSCILLVYKENDSSLKVKPEWYTYLMKVFFLAYVLVVITCCIVVYYRVNKWCQDRQGECMFLVEGDGFSRRNMRGIYCTARSVVLVMVVCWTPAFFLVLLSLLIPKQESLFLLYVLQAITVSLQGFLNSIAYGWLRRNFREAALGERLALLAQNPRAFYDESLTRT
uniref:G-protein coupled receptors family 1 profile domain-containing protein n=1 Tax=Lepisosteus oculatus TaxID=7918 RepID=W5NJD4_LEPOC